MIKEKSSRQDKKRMFFSYGAAIGVHGVLLIILQFTVAVKIPKEEYKGPLFVQLEEPKAMDNVIQEISTQTSLEEKEPLQEKSVIPLIKNEQKNTNVNQQQNKTHKSDTSADTRTNSDALKQNEEKQQKQIQDSSLENDSLSLLDRRLNEQKIKQAGGNTLGTDKLVQNVPQNTQKGKGELTADSILWENGGDRKALITGSAVIPDWVSKQGLKLKGIIQFMVSPEGIVGSVQIASSCGYTDVDLAVVSAIRKWKFEPISSTQWMRAKIEFQIQ